MSSNSFSQKGYTLIELLLYVVTISSLVLAIGSFYLVVRETNNRAMVVSTVEQQGHFVMDHVTRTIRNADTITSPASGSSASSITLGISDAAKNPTIINISSNSVEAKEGAATAVKLSDSKVTVTNLTFKNLSYTGTPGIVQVLLTIEYKSDSDRDNYDYSKTFTSSVSLRP